MHITTILSKGLVTVARYFSDAIIAFWGGRLMLPKQVTPSGGTPAPKRAPDALAAARLLAQCKTVLMVILGSVKQAAAQKAAGG